MGTKVRRGAREVPRVEEGARRGGPTDGKPVIPCHDLVVAAVSVSQHQF